MSGARRTIGWIVVGILAVIVIMSSRPEDRLPEGSKGSYLGRAIADTQTGPADELSKRAGTVQRF
ncbi:MAG TPA: hypothetical protein VLG66_08005 [Alphaproteobacteria bacterium]|jgi:hypothetical protein|nr:hypothetical protein [Pseudolabrys sp.]HSE77933.1 hypothetical protein [Alphaproteobacteria bacterium]